MSRSPYVDQILDHFNEHPGTSTIIGMDFGEPRMTYTEALELADVIQHRALERGMTVESIVEDGAGVPKVLVHHVAGD